MLERGYGSLVSFELEPSRERIDAFLGALQRTRLVHSLGGHRTTLSHAATMTHRLVSREIREELGLHDGFFRLSLGIEDLEDIVEDLGRGLAACSQSSMQTESGAGRR